MTLSVDVDRPATVRDPRDKQSAYRAEYDFEVESQWKPWLVELPIGEATGRYRVRMTVELIPEAGDGS